MVGVFVRLKLRILRNSLRGSALASMLAGGLFGLLAAAVTILAAAAPWENARASVDLLATVYAVWLVGWVLAPVATGGGDETLRPEHFSLLPIGRTRLATGLLTASFVAVTSLVTLLAFGGMVVYGARYGPGPALVGLVFAVLGLALVVLVYRVIMAALSGLLSSRKGKEFGIVLVALLGFAGVGVNYAVNSLGPALLNGEAGGFATVMRTLPSGWGPVAVRAAADGAWVHAVALAVALAVLVVVLLAIWGVLLYRRNTVGGFRGSARSRRDDAEGETRRSGVLPATAVGAVVGKELRTWWRDARRRMALLSGLVVSVVMVLAPMFSAGESSGPGIVPFIGVFVVWVSCMQAGNMYGFDGSALWHTMVAPDAYRADVRGRQLGWALLVGPLGLVLAAVMPAVTDATYAYPWVFGLVPTFLGAGSGMLVLQSVMVPYPLPDPRRNSNPFAQNGRPGASRVLLIFGMALLLAVTSLPVVAVALAGILTGSGVLLWLAVPVGIAVGFLLAWWWGNLAAERLVQRAPELLETVSREA